MGCFNIKILAVILIMLKKILFLFLVLFLLPFFSIEADSSKIYSKGYVNPVNALNSFLWNKKKEGSIGLTSNVFIDNREVTATLHPISFDSSKIKIAFSKIKYLDEKKETTDFIFNEENLEILSKYTSKGLSLANKNQDIIFQFLNKKEEKLTQGIIFIQKNSLNLVFFSIHDCVLEKVKEKKKKKKEFHKNHPNFSFIKKKNCNSSKKEIAVLSSKGIYKKKTNQQYSWIIFTAEAWQQNKSGLN